MLRKHLTECTLPTMLPFDVSLRAEYVRLCFVLRRGCDGAERNLYRMDDLNARTEDWNSTTPVSFSGSCFEFRVVDSTRSMNFSSDPLTDDILLCHSTVDLSRVTSNGHAIAVLECGLQICLTLASKLRHTVESAMGKESQVSVYMETGGENGVRFKKLSQLDKNTIAEEENLERVLVRKTSDAGGCLEFLELKKDSVDAIFNGDDLSDDWLDETTKKRLSVSISSQPVLLRHVREVENLTSEFVRMMGSCCLLHIVNWVYQCFHGELREPGSLNWRAGADRTLLRQRRDVGKDLSL